MNQKIKEFAIQAIAAENPAKYGDAEVSDIQKLLIADLNVFLVEFAKLVAKDCANIAYNASSFCDICYGDVLAEYDVDGYKTQK